MLSFRARAGARDLVIAFAVLLGACTDKDKDQDPTGDTSAAAEEFAVLGDGTNLPAAALYSIWGTHDDMFIVGSDDGAGPVVLHWDGSAWTRLDTSSVPGDLWWVWSLPGSDTIWIGGEGARIVTYSRSAGTFAETVVSNPAYTLFGIWGSSETDIWSNGGDISNALPGVVVHWDGTAWTESATAEPDPTNTTNRQAFKTWGSGASDVWVVGTGALIMHWDGTAWETLPQPVYRTSPLTTVSGTGPNDIYAVGGYGNAVTVQYDGTAWTETSPPPTDTVEFFNGVNASVEFGVVGCGGNGSIYWYDDTGWTADPRARATARDFHACWIDDTGELWAVGGDLTTQTEGVVIHGGDQVSPISL